MTENWDEMINIGCIDKIEIDDVPECVCLSRETLKLRSYVKQCTKQEAVCYNLKHIIKDLKNIECKIRKGFLCLKIIKENSIIYMMLENYGDLTDKPWLDFIWDMSD